MQRLEDAANRLENELKEVKEKMRIMVEYPDLHPTSNAYLSGWQHAAIVAYTFNLLKIVFVPLYVNIFAVSVVINTLLKY